MRPSAEPRQITCARACARRCGNRAWVSRIGARRLMSRTWRIVSASTVSRAPKQGTPAACTRTLQRHCVATLTSSSTWAALPMSATCQAMRPALPVAVAWIERESADNCAAERPTRSTLAPAPMNAAAVSRPIPPFAPVRTMRALLGFMGALRVRSRRLRPPRAGAGCERRRRTAGRTPVLRGRSLPGRRDR